MAALRGMLSVAREEAAIISTELAASARVSAVESVASSSKLGAEALNPLAVRQAVEAGVKEGLGGSSALAEHLALSARPRTFPSAPLAQTLESSLVRPPNISSTRTLIAETLEQDLGVSLREALSNAGQTGVEEQMSEAIDVAKVMAEGQVTVQEAMMEIRAAA